MKYTIIMRSSPKCEYCEKAKALLDSRGIEYELIDIGSRDTAIRVFKALGYKTVPLVIDNHGNVIGGFNELDKHLFLNK